MSNDTQITTGIRSILSHPTIYTMFQYLMGAKHGWTSFVSKYVKPKIGDAVLDIGCGPADILEYLPNVNYWGFDINEKYIARAKSKYGSRGQFNSKILMVNDLEILPKFDLVIASGLLHHVNDEIAHDMMELAFTALKPGGRLVTIDPCFTNDQNKIARYLISKDRGQHVRSKSDYKKLAQGVFSEIQVTINHKVWIPYTHCIMVCLKMS